MNVRLSLLAVLVVVCVGCDEHDHEHGEHSLEEEVCEHMKDGPTVAVMATAEPADAVASAMSFEHKRVDIGLVEVEGQQGGFIVYEADETAEFGDVASD